MFKYIKLFLVFLLSAMLVFSSVSAVAEYFSTMEDGYKNIESKYGPFIGALARAIDGDYEVLDPDYDWKYWFDIWGLNVDAVAIRDASLQLSGYDPSLVAQAVYTSLAESSNDEIRKKAQDSSLISQAVKASLAESSNGAISQTALSVKANINTPELGDSSVSNIALAGLAVLALVGIIVVHSKATT